MTHVENVQALLREIKAKYPEYSGEVQAELEGYIRAVNVELKFLNEIYNKIPIEYSADEVTMKIFTLGLDAMQDCEKAIVLAEEKDG